MGRLYFCTVVNERSAGSGYVFFGREANAKVATAMVEYVVATIRRMSREYSPVKAEQEQFKRGAALRMGERINLMVVEARRASTSVTVSNAGTYPLCTLMRRVRPWTPLARTMGDGDSVRVGPLRSRPVARLAWQAGDRISLNTQVAERRSSRLLG